MAKIPSCKMYIGFFGMGNANTFIFVISVLRTMYIIFKLVAFVFKVLSVLDVILQKFGIKLLRITKERVLKGKLASLPSHITKLDKDIFGQQLVYYWVLFWKPYYVWKTNWASYFCFLYTNKLFYFRLFQWYSRWT